MSWKNSSSSIFWMPKGKTLWNHLRTTSSSWSSLLEITSSWSSLSWTSISRIQCFLNWWQLIIWFTSLLKTYQIQYFVYWAINHLHSALQILYMLSIKIILLKRRSSCIFFPILRINCCKIRLCCHQSFILINIPSQTWLQKYFQITIFIHRTILVCNIDRWLVRNYRELVLKLFSLLLLLHLLWNLWNMRVNLWLLPVWWAHSFLTTSNCVCKLFSLFSFSWFWNIWILLF